MLDTRNTVIARAEWVQKSAADLVLDAAPFAFPSEQTFDVGETSLGYIREVVRSGSGTLGIGAMGTVNYVPSGLRTTYGSRTPLGAFVFLRLRPAYSRTTASMNGVKGMKSMSGMSGG